MIKMFEIQKRGSTVGREVFGGITTFMAMSYIIFVQVGVLGQTGMDTGGIIVATCLSSAIASIMMGLMANYPIALAPGMGENFFFAFTLCGVGAAAGVFKFTWQEALALVAVSGTVFLILSFVGFRSYILNAIPASLKCGIAAGIGLMISTIGLWNGNIVGFSDVAGPGLVGFSDNPSAVLTLLGLLVILVLMAFRVRGAVLIGILFNAALALFWGLLDWPGQIVAMPTGIAATAGGCFEGFAGLWNLLWTHRAVEVVIFTLVLLMMDMFDTVGTLVGVASRANLMKDGRLPKADRALAADAIGTIVGAGFGSSTVTAYIESVTGVSVGARTGLAAIVTGLLMLLAIFFQPIIHMIGGGVEISAGVYKHPLVAPALIIVGAMMLKSIRDINWEDVTEYLPAFLTVIVMPLTLSISNGIAIGFVSYAAGKLLTGKPKKCPVMVYVVAVLFIIRYVIWQFLPAGR